jgi:uncharacterized membrane protein YvbJ
MHRLCENCRNELKQGEKRCPKCGHQAAAEATQEKSKARKQPRERKQYVHETSGDGAKKLIIYFVIVCLVLGGIMLLSLYAYRNNDYIEESFQAATEPVAIEMAWDREIARDD